MSHIFCVLHFQELDLLKHDVWSSWFSQAVLSPNPYRNLIYFYAENRLFVHDNPTGRWFPDSRDQTEKLWTTLKLFGFGCLLFFLSTYSINNTTRKFIRSYQDHFEYGSESKKINIYQGI